MTGESKPTAALDEDVALLERVASKIAQALYYHSDALRGVPRGDLTHDDYDLLRALAKRMKVADLEAQLAALRDSNP